MKFNKQILLGSVVVFAFSSALSSGFGQQTQIETSDVKQTSAIQSQAPLSATDDDWHVAITPYAWVPGVDLNVQAPVSIRGHQATADLSLNDNWTKVLGSYGPGFRILCADGRIEVSKGKWGAFIDGYWMYIKATGGVNGTKVGFADRHDLDYAFGLTSKLQFAQVNFGPRYLLGTIPINKAADVGVGFELYGGGRFNYLSETLDASLSVNNANANLNASVSRGYVEPLFGIKTIWTLGPNFIGIIRGDIGGWNLVDNNTDCDLEAGIAWLCHKNTYLDLAYRARGQWQTDGSSNNVSVRGWFNGPEFGMSLTF